MVTYQVAHIHDGDRQVIFFLVDAGFGALGDKERKTALKELQQCAMDAGLAGHAVAAWKDGDTPCFFGPQEWHDFLHGLSYEEVASSVNTELDVDF